MYVLFGMFAFSVHHHTVPSLIVLILTLPPALSIDQ